MEIHIFIYFLLAALFARAELGCSQSVFIPPIELRALPANLGNPLGIPPKMSQQKMQMSGSSPELIQQKPPMDLPPPIVVTPPREPPASAPVMTDTDPTDLHSAVHNFLNVFAVNTSDHRSAEDEFESLPTERKSHQGYTYWKPHVPSYWDSPEYEEPYQPYHVSEPYESEHYKPSPYLYDLPTYQHPYRPPPYHYGPPAYESNHPPSSPPATAAPAPAPTVKPIVLKPAVPIVPATVSPLLIKKTEVISTLISSLATAATGLKTPTGLVSGLLQVILATIARKGLKGLIGKLALPIVIIVVVNLLIVVLIWFLWEECPVVAPPATIPPPPPPPTIAPTPYPYHYPSYRPNY